VLPPLPAADTLAGGAIVGDNIGFWVGRELGPSLLARWAHLIGLDERKRMLGRYLFDRHGGKIVFFGRFVACCAPLRHLLAWRKRVASFAISHLQCSGGNCLGDSVRSWRIRTWRRHSPNRRTIWLGGAHCAIVFAFLLWRYYKRNEKRFLDDAEAAAANPAQ